MPQFNGGTGEAGPPRDQHIEDLDTLEDLIDWLESMKWADLR